MPESNEFTASASATAIALGLLGDNGLLMLHSVPSGGAVAADDSAITMTVISVDTPLELDDSAVFELERAPQGAMPADLMARITQHGMIMGNLRDISRAGSYVRLSQFPVDVARAQADFRPNQLEEHLQWCLLAFERIQRDRAEWAALFEKAFYVETELIQFAENEKVYAEEVDAGLYSNAYKEAYYDAEAIRLEAYHARWSEFQLKSVLDEKFKRIPNEVAVDEFSAWMGTLSTYADQRAKDSFLANPFVGDLIGKQSGSKPDMAQYVAAWQSRVANNMAVSLGRADEISRQGEANAKAERFQTAVNRMLWELANGLFRRQRADNARAASFAKAAAFVLPGGALGFRDQMDALQARIGRDVSEVVARAAVIEEGLATFYGIDVVGRESAVAIADHEVARLDQIDALYLWLRDCASELDRFKQVEQNYVLPVSLRRAMGEAAWASRPMPGFWTFKLPIHPWFDGESHFRVRGVRAYAYGVAPEDGFWDLRFQLPQEGVVRGLHGEISVVNQNDLPEVRLPRVGARDQREPVEFVGVSALANASPIGSENGTAGNCWIAIQGQSSQRVPTSKITDIELEIAIASRRWLT